MPKDLTTILDAENVVTLLDKELLDKISYQAIQGYKGDETSRADWKDRNQMGMDLAMQIAGPARTLPFDGAADVKYPLISVAAIQFASRAYPNLIPGYDIVRGKVVGKDGGTKAEKAQRVATHMNYQLNEEMTEWIEESDRLLTVLPITGCCFKETYWSRAFKRIVSRYISPIDLVMHYKAKSIETVPRITKRYNLYPNEITELIRSGVFIKFDIDQPVTDKDEDQGYGDDASYSEEDEYRPHLFLQQHTWLDLDDDGYAEPYILNIHYDTQRVVRIVPRFNEGDLHLNDKGNVQRIDARQHYTKFTFMHSPDGGIYDLGFGALLLPMNETINTLIDQILDAATLNNDQAGFVGGGIGIGRGKTGGPIRFERGELKPIKFSGDDLRKNIVMLNEFMKDPSPVLFSLLGFMVEAGEKLSVTELLTGEQSIQNEPATTSLARLEQGLKVFSAVHKRVHNGFKHEYHKIFNLNAEYLDETHYFTLQDDPEMQREAYRTDYDKESCDIIPTSSPEDVSNTTKMMKSEARMALRGQGLDDMEIIRLHLEALQTPDIDKLMNAPTPPEDPKVVNDREKLSIDRDKLEFEMAVHGDERDIKQLEILSKIFKNIAEAEAKEAGPQLEEHKIFIQGLMAEIKDRQQARALAAKTAQASPASSAGGNGGGE